MKNFIIISIFLFSITIDLKAQDCKFWDETNYSGGLWDLNIGQSVEIDLDGCFFCGPEAPSWKILNNNAAILIERLSLPDAYPFMLVYSEKDAPGVGGTDQYDNAGLVRVTCKNKCLTEDCLPQPTAWIPVDKNNVNGPIANLGDTGDTVMVLRKAFFWENSEDLDCFHGPWASLGIRAILPESWSGSFDDYNLLNAYYCECSDCPQSIFCNSVVADSKLPGPIWTADQNCTFAPVPGSEWIDGPWGCCYSNIPILNWKNFPNNNSLFVYIREGDDTNIDDFMGGTLINKSLGTHLIKALMFGWVIVENIIVPNSGSEETVDVSDFYWFNNWNGQSPDENQPLNPPFFEYFPVFPPEPYRYDQYIPLSNRTINEMESVFIGGSTIGLIGGKFPSGTLSKPMTYKAPCQPAIFGQ